MTKSLLCGLVALLLSGQTALALHDVEHALAGEQADCEICLAAQVMDHAAASKGLSFGTVPSANGPLPHFETFQASLSRASLKARSPPT